MNKYIKQKRFNKINYREYFTKEDSIFINQFKYLYYTCKSTNINRLTILRLYKHVLKNTFITKNEFEISIRMILCGVRLSCDIKNGSRYKYYIDLYRNMGIKFIKEDNRIKINYIEVKECL